jgi:hypothetical protein
MGVTKARVKKIHYADDRLQFVLYARDHLPRKPELAVILAN